MTQYWIILIYSLFLRDDNVQEFDTRWDEALLYMSTFPSDDVLESLYKLRIRESAQLKTVLLFRRITQVFLIKFSARVFINVMWIHVW